MVVQEASMEEVLDTFRPVVSLEEVVVADLISVLVEVHWQIA
jgi:hypothetical protein